MLMSSESKRVCAVSRGVGGRQGGEQARLARDSTCRPLMPPPASHLPLTCQPAQGTEQAERLGQREACLPRASCSLTSCLPRRETSYRGSCSPPWPARLRTVEQEAIWGGMGAVRRRQPPEDPFRHRLPPSSDSRLNCGVRIDWECKWQLKCNLHSQQEWGGEGEGTGWGDRDTRAGRGPHRPGAAGGWGKVPARAMGIGKLEHGRPPPPCRQALSALWDPCATPLWHESSLSFLPGRVRSYMGSLRFSDLDQPGDPAGPGLPQGQAQRAPAPSYSSPFPPCGGFREVTNYPVPQTGGRHLGLPLSQNKGPGKRVFLRTKC